MGRMPRLYRQPQAPAPSVRRGTETTPLLAVQPIIGNQLCQITMADGYEGMDMKAPPLEREIREAALSQRMERVLGAAGPWHETKELETLNTEGCCDWPAGRFQCSAAAVHVIQAAAQDQLLPSHHHPHHPTTSTVSVRAVMMSAHTFRNFDAPPLPHRLSLGFRTIFPHFHLHFSQDYCASALYTLWATSRPCGTVLRPR